MRKFEAILETEFWERDIQYSMSMVLDTRFHTWFIMTVFYKMRQILLQNVTAILLQNVTKVYYKMRQVFYYKMRHLLQNESILLQIMMVITNCDSTDAYKSIWFKQCMFIWNLFILFSSYWPSSNQLKDTFYCERIPKWHLKRRSTYIL